MPVYKANALVLRRIPLGEQDKIVTLLTREHGKLRAVAKGARRTTSRLAGASEPLMFLRALLAEGMNLDVLTQCEVRESFPYLRGDLGLFLRATYACELTDRMTTDRNIEPDVFDLLLSTLYVLQRAEDPDATLFAFELRLMAQAGYEPVLDTCVRCETPFAGNVLPAGYGAILGGALCGPCTTQTRDETLPLSPETRAALSDLLGMEDARALATRVLSADVRAEAARILRAHLRHRLERDVRSTELLDAMRIGAMELEPAPLVARAKGEGRAE